MTDDRRPAGQKRLFVHGLIILAIMVVGSAVGVVLGEAWQQRDDPRVRTLASRNSHDVFPASDQLVLDTGDRMPSIDVFWQDGSVTSSDSLLEGHPTVLLVWSLGCDGCLEIASKWDSQMSPRIRRDAQTYVCLDKQYMSEIDDHRDLLGNRQVIFLDYKNLKQTINLALLPQVIVLDPQRFIVHVDYGVHGGFDPEVVEYLIESK